MKVWLLLALLIVPGAVAQANATDDTTDNATLVPAPPDPLVLHRWDNPLPAPLDGAWGTFALNLLAWAAISLFAIFAIGPVLKRLAQVIPGEIDDDIVSIVRAPGFAILFIFGVTDSVRGLPLSARWAGVLDVLWKVLWIVAATVMVYRLFKEVVLSIGRKMARESATQLDDRLYPFFAKVGGVVIILAAIFFLLGSTGMDLTVFAAGAGVLSLVLAFAAQDTLSNFFAGVFILLDQPFREGDRVELKEEGTWGDVTNIGLRSTRIRTRDNRMVIVPNALIGANAVVNHSFPDSTYRIAVEVGVAYGSDVDRVTEVLMAAIESIPEVLKDHRNEVLFRRFGESSLDFMVRAWFPHFIDARRFEDRLNRAIDKHLAAAGIEIPFPQRVVHLRND